MTPASGPPRIAGARPLVDLTSFVLVGVAGSAGYMVVPLVVAALRHGGATPELWIGLVGSADPAGMFLGAALALLAPVRLAPRRAASIALATSLLCNAASLLSPPIWALLLCRFLSGAGGGIALALALSLLGRTPHPDRNFAIMTLSQMVFGMIAASVAGAGLAGLGTIYQTLFATQLLALGVCWVFPRLTAASMQSGPARALPRLNRRLLAITALANLCSAAGFLVLWANIEALARRAQVADSLTVTMLDVGMIGGFAGTLLTAVIDGRNRRWPLAALLYGLGLLGTLLVEWPFHWLVPFVAVFLFQIGPAAVTYGFGAISQSDPSGRLPIVHILSVKAGFAIAPLAGSLLVSGLGLGSVVPAAFIVTLLAMLCYRLQIAEAERDIAALAQDGPPAAAVIATGR